MQGESIHLITHNEVHPHHYHSRTSAMDGGRRSSVYDFAALRLHPDGSRVHQTSENLTLGKRKNTVYSPRRGWFAKDAGGSSIILGQKTKLKRKFSEVGDSDCDGDGDDGSTSADESVVAEQETRGRTMERKVREVKSMRAKKRRRSEEDDTFLGKLADKEKEDIDRPHSVCHSILFPVVIVRC